MRGLYVPVHPLIGNSPECKLHQLSSAARRFLPQRTLHADSSSELNFVFPPRGNKDHPQVLYGKSISDVTVQRGGVHLRRFAAIGRARKYSFNDRHPFFLPGSLTILKEYLSLEGQLRGASGPFEATSSASSRSRHSYVESPSPMVLGLLGSDFGTEFRIRYRMEFGSEFDTESDSVPNSLSE